MAGAAAFWLGIGGAQAQQVPAASVPAAPSVVGRDVLRVAPTPPEERPTISVTPSIGLNLPPAVLEREVEFHNVTVEGTTAFAAKDVQPLFAPVLDRRLRFSDVVQAVDRLGALYEREGYVFYSLSLPQQDLGGDTLRVVVTEGSIGKIEIDESITSEKARQRIKDLLAPLVGRHPLRKSQLERQLLLSADTPGAALSATAKPTEGDPTKVDIVIHGTFERFQPIAQLDDFQTTPNTSVNFRVGGIGRSLLFGGDQLELRYLFVLPWNSLNLVDARYGVPIGTDGGRLSLLGQAVWQRPPTYIDGQGIDYLARSFLGRVSYSQPIVRKPDWTVMGYGMLDVIGVDYSFAGFYIPGDSLRVARGGTTAAVTDGLGGVWLGSALASAGLGLANASANGRFGAVPTFFKTNLSVERIQPIGSTVTVIAKATGQLTSGTVPASEVFAYGGRD